MGWVGCGGGIYVGVSVVVDWLCVLGCCVVCVGVGGLGCDYGFDDGVGIVDWGCDCNLVGLVLGFLFEFVVVFVVGCDECVLYC